MRFAILGLLEIRDDDDRPVSLGAGRQRMLLAILLLHANEVLATERLIDELWGEEPAGVGYEGSSGLRHAPTEDARLRLGMRILGYRTSPATCSS